MNRHERRAAAALARGEATKRRLENHNPVEASNDGTVDLEQVLRAVVDEELRVQ